MKPANFPSAARLRNIKFNRTWVILAVALTIGGLAALAARGYLNRQMAAIEAQGKGKTVMAVVAKSDIAKGVRLSADNLAVRAIPVEYAQSTAVVPADFDRIEGQALAYPVKSGEMILWGLMETQRMPTFSARVAAGRRAMTVSVDEINSISGMLEPGDLIDLMVTLDKDGKKITFPLMQHVYVMATGQRSQDDPKTGNAARFSTVTIDASALEARYLIAARDQGRITALLRNPNDKQPIDDRSYDVARLLGLSGPTTAGNRGEKGVPVIYGGNLGRMSPEEMRLQSRAQRMAGMDTMDANPPFEQQPAAPAQPGMQVAPGAPGAPAPAAAPANGAKPNVASTLQQEALQAAAARIN